MSFQRAGRSKADVVVVLVVSVVLSGAFVPQLYDRPGDHRMTKAEYHLATLRAAIETYREQHGGRLPPHDERVSLMAALTARTSPTGRVSPQGSCGPYLTETLTNPLTGESRVATTLRETLDAESVTRDNAGGWLYNPQTGRIFLDSDPGFEL